MDEEYSEFSAAIGFSSMIHDYLEFNEKMVKEKKFKSLVDFLIRDVELNEVLRKRIENFTF